MGLRQEADFQAEEAGGVEGDGGDFTGHYFREAVAGGFGGRFADVIGGGPIWGVHVRGCFHDIFEAAIQGQQAAEVEEHAGFVD